MKITIHAPWEVNDHLKSLINEKIEKLNSYYNDGFNSVDVFLKKDTNQKPVDKLVEVRARATHKEFFAQSNAETFEIATAEVAEKLRRQLEKKKTSNRQGY